MEKAGNGESSLSLMGSLCTRQGAPAPCCIILESLADGVLTIDLDRRITPFFNKSAQLITGFSPEEAVGQYCFDVLRSNICQTNCPLEEAIDSGLPVADIAALIVNKEGKEIPVHVSISPIRSEQGEIIGAIEVIRDISALEALRKALSGRYRLGDLISKNPRMLDIFEILPDIAESDSTVLIEGPSGSGKEVLATAIHEMSRRKGRPFVKVNCAAIPDGLLESELFGYVKGAFTDAKRDKPGRFSMAHTGTLFLDEVGDMSPALQVKLLRVLEDRQYIPLGGTSPQEVDVRIISASNKPLLKLVDEGRFRDDLYYRLNIIRIELPPLKERKEDIPLLIESFLHKLNSIKGKFIDGVSDEAMAVLMNYDFPGNIRELENIMEHAYVLCREHVIDVRHLPLEVVERVKEKGTGDIPRSISPLESAEASTILQALRRHGGNRRLAAMELGISRSTLWRKMRKYNLE